MSEPSWDTLRSEYDAAVLDPAQRAQRARRLRAALTEAGLWPMQGRVLDVATGSGLLLAALGTDVARVGCDLRRELYLQAKTQADGILFAQCDGHALPFRGNQFDLAICLAAIEEFPDWRKALEEMARSVAPGGVLYVTFTNGRFLLRLYAVAERLRLRVPSGWWAYGRSSLRMPPEDAPRGFDLLALRGWRCVDVTPYLVRGQWPWVRGIPIPLLDWVCRRLAPSFGFAWQRPAE